MRVKIAPPFVVSTIPFIVLVTVLLGIRKGYLEIAQGYLFDRCWILCWIYTQPDL